MTNVVLDANVVVRIADPQEPGHAEALEAYAALVGAGYEPIGPDVLVYELGNVARRNGSHLEARGLLDALEVCEYRQLSLEQVVRTYAIARQDGLTFADAAYLTLAEAERTLVWTEDGDLLRAAEGRAARTVDVVAALG